MANIYYKFNSELSFDRIGFDGLHISVVDLKKAILHQKRLGKSADFDLLISNAQTKEEYIEDNCLIPKNTSVIVARVPVSNQYNKKWENLQSAAVELRNASEPNASASAENIDLSKMNGTEEDKIQAMMVQSTLDYDPASYQRVRGSTSQVGEVPQNYRCHRCHKAGHWIKNCPLNPIKDHFHSKVRPENKKMTGIPRSLRDNPPSNETTEQPKIIEQKLEPPEDLLCSICKGIFKDAVMIPCCGSSFCDECIRTALLETDDNECPECAEKGTSPGSLIPNRFLRTNVAAFLSDSNANVGREKNSESHEENVVKNILDSPFKDDIKEVDTDEPLDVMKKETSSSSETPRKEHENETPELKNVDKNEQNETSDDDEDEDDDNIVVTVPPASAAYKETSGLVRVTQQSRAKEISERQNVLEETHENNQHNSGQFSDNYYYPEHFNDQHVTQQHAPFSPDESEKNYMVTISSTNNNQAPYLPRNMYNQQAPTSQMPIRPAMYGGQYPLQSQQQQQPPPFYPQQQNMRPYRFEHRGDYQQPMRHHHHQGHHYQHHYSMPASGHENFGLRYQRPMHNLANIVSQNIQQRFGTGVIEDPLEAFNKMMREKEMRKDRFKRSPARFNETRGRSPIRKYSPEIRHKSPHRRRKRTRSFSSNSSRSRSRSRSFDRHHNKDYRRKYRGTEKNKQFDNRRSKNRKSYSPDAKKSNQDNFKSGHIQQEEIIRTSVDENKAYSNLSNDLSSNQPPPPGEEICEKEHEGMKDFIQSVAIEERVAKDVGEKSPSSEEAKHGKKTRDRKKHKKSSETKSKKKKKRDRREKRSQSNTPVESENNTLKDNETPIEDESDNLSKTNEMKHLTNEQVETTANISGANDEAAENDFRPELSKWEKDIEDDQPIDKCDNEKQEHEKSLKENEKISNFEEKSDFEVTTEIIKRAENLIFSKSSNVTRLNHEKVSDKSKDSSPLLSVIKKVENEKKYDSFQVIVPVESGARSVELKAVTQMVKSNKKEPGRTSIKERLGKKVSERSKSRSREKETNNSSSSRIRKPDNRKLLSSYINSAPSSSKSDSTRARERTVRRRSRSHNRNESGNKRHQRSKSRNSKDNEGQRDRNHKSKNSLELHSNKKEQKKRRSDSPLKSDVGHERKKMRSSSTESKRQKKKKKKEKKSKKKSRDRK